MANIKRFKNRHEGERVFLIGNGPSLKETSLEMLNDEYTIAMNKINKIYPNTDWRPSYYLYQRTAPPTKARIQNYLETIDLGIPSFISSDNQSYFPDKNNIFYFKRDSVSDSVRKQVVSIYHNRKKSVEENPQKHLSNLFEYLWSEDCNKKVYSMSTSMYPAAQIASYMGFDQLYFVGCDLGYESSKPYMFFDEANDPKEYVKTNTPKIRNYIDFVFECPNPPQSLINGILYLVSSNYYTSGAYFKLYYFFSGSDQNHFTNSYQHNSSPDEGTNNRQIRAHWIIKNIGEIVGFNAFNATVGGELEVYPRLDFNKVVRK